MSDELLIMVRDIRTTQLQQAEQNGRMAGQLDALAGPEGRVTKLEKERTRQWWFSMAIAPVLAALHGVLRHFGVDI